MQLGLKNKETRHERKPKKFAGKGKVQFREKTALIRFKISLEFCALKIKKILLEILISARIDSMTCI